MLDRLPEYLTSWIEPLTTGVLRYLFFDTKLPLVLGKKKSWKKKKTENNRFHENKSEEGRAKFAKKTKGELEA